MSDQIIDLDSNNVKTKRMDLWKLLNKDKIERTKNKGVEKENKQDSRLMLKDLFEDPEKIIKACLLKEG